MNETDGTLTISLYDEECNLILGDLVIQQNMHIEIINEELEINLNFFVAIQRDETGDLQAIVNVWPTGCESPEIPRSFPVPFACDGIEANTVIAMTMREGDLFGHLNFLLRIQNIDADIIGSECSEDSCSCEISNETVRIETSPYDGHWMARTLREGEWTTYATPASPEGSSSVCAVIYVDEILQTMGVPQEDCSVMGEAVMVVIEIPGEA